MRTRAVWSRAWPSAPATVSGSAPPGSPGGTVTVSRDARAALTRAGTSPMRTSGSAGPDVSKPSPMTVTRPPSVAAEGVTLSYDEARGEGYVRTRCLSTRVPSCRIKPAKS